MSRRRSPRAGEPPKGANVDIRGQIPPMQADVSGLGDRSGAGRGRRSSCCCRPIFNRCGWRWSTVSTAPAVIAGVVPGMLWITRTTLEHSIVHRRDHGDRRGDGQRDSAGHLCRASPPRGAPAVERGPRRRRQPRAADSDDQPGDDRRHDPDGAGAWAKGASRPPRWAEP